MLSGLKPVETTGGLRFVPDANVSRGLKTEAFCITQFFLPPFHVHLEKCRIKCTKNLQSLTSVSRGQALSNNSVEQGAALIPHPFSFINLFYKDQLQVESWSLRLGQAPVCNGKK